MKTIIRSLALLTALLAGCSDYEEALKQEAHYCAMVEAGTWPAYNELINCKMEK
jgi:hypothetical protein|tara:strand:+ start:1037 stop:1198 length:162 start_codon:yes stop_codon:yes gene_type:complete